VPTGPRFVPRDPPADAAAFVSQAISSAPYRHQARLLVHAPAHQVADRFSPTTVRLEPVDEDHCVLHTGANSLDEIVLHIGLKGFDFEVLDPPELVDAVRLLADRLSRAAGATG
jgi:predicted DNA-binding transcriptional regulator YafY